MKAGGGRLKLVSSASAARLDRCLARALARARDLRWRLEHGKPLHELARDDGCSRPYVAEIALSGRAPGKYNLYLGGGFHGERLNAMVLENVGEPVILGVMEDLLGRYAAGRNTGERLGDFVTRTGYAPA